MTDAADSDVSIGGPHLAAAAIRAGLVDEYQQYLAPIIVGGGTAYLPTMCACNWSCSTSTVSHGVVVFCVTGSR